MTIEALLAALLPSLCVSIFMAIFNKRQKQREKEVDERANARKKESLLALDMQMATAKLAYATAMALKRGHANGEVEEGIASYQTAREKYLHFLNEQAADHLN